MVPTVNPDYIRIARLSKKMQAISEYPLTIIHSGAGYGKSTGLALYVNDTAKSCCWYTISAMDDDILPFLTNLIYSIQMQFPEYGMELIQYMQEMDRYIREEELTILCSLFIDEVISINEEIIVILDDFHQIEHSFTINRWLEKVIEYIPSQLHMVISSRSRPSWKELTRMRVSRRLLEITQQDFTLTMEEMELLLTEFYHVSLSKSELKRIYELTEGWVITLGMMVQHLSENGELTDLSIGASQSLQELFQYLLLEVFTKQPPMIQQFLQQTCIFEEISETICDAIIGIPNSSAMLDQLTSKNLFIQKMGENKYKYHALFREFLEKQLRINQPQQFEWLHEQSARFFEANGMWEQALLHLEKINRLSVMASILNEYGFKMLENGKLVGLYDRLVLIPENELNRFFQLWYLKGEVLRYRSAYREAEDCYNQAITCAEKRQDVVRKSRALEGKARIYLDTIQPYHAERFLYQAIELREQDCESPAEEIAILYQLLAENLINSGKASKAEKWINRAKALNVPITNENLEARLYLRTGRFKQAREILMALKESVKKELPQSHRETDLVLSLIASFTGDGLAAKKLAQQSIELGIRTNAPFVEACGWIRMGHAVQLTDQYEFSLAIQCYETALKMMDDLQVGRGKAEPQMGLCLLYGSKGEYEQAISAGKSALKETERVHDLWLSALITLCMGIVSMQDERKEDALILFAKAGDLAFQSEDDYIKMLCHLWRAVVYFQMEQTSLFSNHFSECMKLVQLRDYEFIFYNRTIFGPRDLQILAPLLMEARKQNIYKDYVVKILQKMGLAKLQSHPGYTLRIQALGTFRVWLGKKEIEDRHWQRGKAKELFQLFLTYHQQLISKEEIFQKLWPDQDEASCARDFKVALNAVNNALEPERKARSTPFFIKREGTAYGINPDAVLEFDVTQFVQWVHEGLEEGAKEHAITCLEKGLKYYNGDFLAERRYEDWCINERERLLVYFLRGAEKLAQLFVRNEDYEAAIYWCEKIIERDRTWEEAYRLLMYSFYRKNNRPQAIKWYQKCCSILEDELGVSPLQPTQQMYEMILKSN